MSQGPDSSLPRPRGRTECKGKNCLRAGDPHYISRKGSNYAVSQGDRVFKTQFHSRKFPASSPCPPRAFRGQLPVRLLRGGVPRQDVIPGGAFPEPHLSAKVSGWGGPAAMRGTLSSA